MTCATRKSDHYPFGAKRIETGTDVSQREYIGEHFDEETNLSYLNARYYENARGQFLSQDPVFWEVDQNLENPQSLNSYSYALNNPVNLVDPEGEAAFSAILGALIIALTTLADLLASPEIAHAPANSTDFSQIQPDTAETLKRLETGALIVGLATGKPGADDLASKGDDVLKFILKKKGGKNIDDIIPPNRQRHILSGDKDGGGGHRAGTGRGKTEFPSSWSDSKILDNVADIATDSKSSWRKQANGRYAVEGAREGVKIRVVVSRDKSSVVTAHPIK